MVNRRCIFAFQTIVYLVCMEVVEQYSYLVESHCGMIFPAMPQKSPVFWPVCARTSLWRDRIRLRSSTVLRCTINRNILELSPPVFLRKTWILAPPKGCGPFFLRGRFAKPLGPLPAQGRRACVRVPNATSLLCSVNVLEYVCPTLRRSRAEATGFPSHVIGYVAPAQAGAQVKNSAGFKPPSPLRHPPGTHPPARSAPAYPGNRARPAAGSASIRGSRPHRPAAAWSRVRSW